MFHDILKYINTLGYISKPLIAREFDLSSNMVDISFEELERMGCLEEVKSSTCHSSSCGSCPYAKMCAKEVVKTYKLTDKGKSLLKN